MRAIALAFGLMSLLLIGGCDKGPSDLDLRAESFAKADLTEESVRAHLEGFFTTEYFLIKDVKVEDGRVAVDIHAGRAGDKQAVLLKAAATGYAFYKILFSNPAVDEVAMSQSVTMLSGDAPPEQMQALSFALTRDQAEQVKWAALERDITMDRDYEKPLASYGITEFHPSLAEFVAPLKKMSGS